MKQNKKNRCKQLMGLLAAGGAVFGALPVQAEDQPHPGKSKPKPAKSKQKVGDVHLDVSAALPAETELFPAKTFHVTVRDHYAVVSGLRQSDGASFDVHIIVEDSVDQAHEIILGIAQKTGSSAAAKPLEEGTPSGRRIGEVAYQSATPESEGWNGRFCMAARDGCSVVRVRLFLQPEIQNGTMIFPPVSPADIKLVEDQLVLALGKLTKMGHTSKSKPADKTAKSKPKK